MALTKIPRGLLDTGVADSSDATAITIDSSENVTFAGNILKTGNLTLDVSGDITLDADGADINFQDGGTLFGQISNASGLYLVSNVSDAPMYLRGNDGGSYVNAIAIDFANGGKVGIGTTSPGNFLHVKGTGETQVYIDAATNNNPGVRFLENGTNKWTIGNDNTNDGLFFYDFGASAERMRITSGGAVGIGITNPTEKFTVVNSSSGIVARFTNNTNQTLDLGVISGSGSAGGVYYNSANSGYHRFQVGTESKLVISANGNVGIGTTSPDTLLDIEYTASNHTQGIHITNSQPGGYGNAITFISERSDNNSLEVAARIRTEGAAAWNADNTTNSNLIFEARDANTLSEKMRVTANGDLCIGVTSNAGSASNVKRIRAGVFATYQGATAATHNTPTTMFSLPGGLGTYILTAGFDGIGNTNAYSSCAIVHGDGTSYKMTTLTTSTAMSWDISGSNVRVQQSSGSTLNVSWSMIRIQ